MGRATVKIKFDSISFLSHPSEIDNIYSNLSVTYLTDDHTKSRLIQVNPTILKLFRDYFTDSHGDVANAAMASIKNSSILEIMETIKNYNYRVSTVCPNHFSNEFWHETANTKDLTITKQSGFATQTSEIIYSGPNFYVGNPYYKSAKRIFDSKKAYDSIHIEFIGEEDVPRTLYKPNVTKDEYRSRIPIYTNTIGDECRLDTNYRLINREMIDNLSERTLITAIIPPKTSHVHTILGNVFESDDILLDSFSFSLSIVVDFYVRSRSLSHANNGVIR
jgi:hypothetical protein